MPTMPQPVLRSESTMEALTHFQTGLSRRIVGRTFRSCTDESYSRKLVEREKLAGRRPWLGPLRGSDRQNGLA